MKPGGFLRSITVRAVNLHGNVYLCLFPLATTPIVVSMNLICPLLMNLWMRLITGDLIVVE